MPNASVPPFAKLQVLTGALGRRAGPLRFGPDALARREAAARTSGSARRRFRLASTRMRQNAQLRQLRAAGVVFPVGDRFDAHQHIPAALLAGLDHIALQFLALGVAGMHDAAPGPQRNEMRDAEFRQFLDQKLAAVPLGKRGGDLDAISAFANSNRSASRSYRDGDSVALHLRLLKPPASRIASLRQTGELSLLPALRVPYKVE